MRYGGDTIFKDSTYSIPNNLGCDGLANMFAHFPSNLVVLQTSVDKCGKLLLDMGENTRETLKTSFRTRYGVDIWDVLLIIAQKGCAWESSSI